MRSELGSGQSQVAVTPPEVAARELKSGKGSKSDDTVLCPTVFVLVRGVGAFYSIDIQATTVCVADRYDDPRCYESVTAKLHKRIAFRMFEDMILLLVSVEVEQWFRD